LRPCLEKSVFRIGIAEIRLGYLGMLESDLFEIAVFEADPVQIGGYKTTGVQIGLVEKGVPAADTAEVAADDVGSGEIAIFHARPGEHGVVKLGVPK
jgi:hypothetical protein